MDLVKPGTDASQSALHYVSDTEPGFTRRRRGKGFSYHGPGGNTVHDARTLARIRGLAIPPAWTDVWICRDPQGHLQATGRDQRGRKQYRYHPEWSALRDEEKYSGLADFARALPRLREAVATDLSRAGVVREKVLASVVWLLDHTMIRIGNDAYARENKSFGLTTLRNTHLDVQGARVRFTFTGKSGRQWRLALVDRRIAAIMRSVQDLPGQHLLQYLDAEGGPRDITSTDVNGYIQYHAGSEFSSKDFRTWGGTVRALWQFAAVPVPESRRERQRELNAVIDGVAARLGNTRAICRKCYVHPGVVSAWETGILPEQISAVRSRRSRKGLDEEESLTLRWLERYGALA